MFQTTAHESARSTSACTASRPLLFLPFLLRLWSASCSPSPPLCLFPMRTDQAGLTCGQWLLAAPRPLLLSTELSSVSTLAGMPPSKPRPGLLLTPLAPNEGGSVCTVAGGWPTPSDALLGGSASMCFRPLGAKPLGLRPPSSREVILSVSCRPE